MEATRKSEMHVKERYTIFLNAETEAVGDTNTAPVSLIRRQYPRYPAIFLLAICCYLLQQQDQV
jgi:hypothetical protein